MPPDLQTEGEPAGKLLVSLAQLAPGLLPTALFDNDSVRIAAKSLGLGDLDELLVRLEQGDRLLRRGDQIALVEKTREQILAAPGGERAAAAVRTALTLLLAAFPVDPGDFHEWKRCRALAPQVRALLARTEELELESVDAALLFARCSEYLTATGGFESAKVLANAAFAAAPSPPVEIAARVRHSLGVVLLELGELEQARLALEEAVSPEVRDLDPRIWRACQLALGEVLAELAEFTAARASLELIQVGAEPVDRLDTQALRRLAWLLMEEGDHEAAEGAYRQALTVSIELLGPGHPDAALARGELGALLLEREEWDDAREALERALAEAAEVLGAEHPAVGVIASNLGGALVGLERFAAARDAVERALAIGRETLPAGHRNLWLRHRKLLKILGVLDDYEAAAEHAEAAVEISENALPADDSEAIRDQLALAAALYRLGEDNRARERYEPALDRLEAVLGPGDPEVAEHQLELGGLLAELGDTVNARGYFENALAGSEAGGMQHTQVRIELLDLAMGLAQQLAESLKAVGREAEAKAVLESDRATRQAVLAELLAEDDVDSIVLAARAAGAAMPELAQTALERARALADGVEEEDERRISLEVTREAWSSVAFDAYMAEDYDRSRALYEGVLEMAGDDDAAAGEALDDLADVAAAEDGYERAAELYAQALERKRRTNNEFDVAHTLLLLGRAHRENDDLAEAEKVLSERLEILQELPEQRHAAEAVTLRQLADIAFAGGDREAAVERNREAVAKRREANSSGAELIPALVALGRSLRSLERMEEAAEVFAECVALLRDVPRAERGEIEVTVLQERGDVERIRGNSETAIEIYQRALPLAEAKNDKRMVAYLLLGRGLLFKAAGELERAEKNFLLRLKILEALDEPLEFAEAISLNQLADVQRKRGELGRAIDLYRAAVAKAREGEAKPELVAALDALGDVLLENGDYDESVPVYREALGLWRELGKPDRESLVLLALGRALFRGGDPDGAVMTFSIRLELLRSQPKPNPRAEGVTLHELAEVQRRQGRAEAAAGLFRDAAERKREADDGPGLATTLVGLAVSLVESGRSAEAREPVAEAETLMRALDAPDPTQLASALTLSAELSTDPERALALLEEARNVYESGGGARLADLAGLSAAIADNAARLGRPEAGAAREQALERLGTLLADEGTGGDPERLQSAILQAARLDAGDLVEEGVDRLRTLAERSALAKSSLVRVLLVVGRRAERENLAAAEALFRERIDLLEGFEERESNMEGITRHDLARVLQLDGRTRDAAALYGEAVDLKAAGGNELGAARSLSALANLLLQEDRDSARDAAVEAVEILRGRGDARPTELPFALGLLGYLEDNPRRAYEILDEAGELADALADDGPRVDPLKRALAKLREMRGDRDT